MNYIKSGDAILSKYWWKKILMAINKYIGDNWLLNNSVIYCEEV